MVGSLILSANTKTLAGDREWATVGKVLTGVAALHVVDRIVNPPQPVVVYQQPVIVQHPTSVIVPHQTIVIQSSPVVYSTVPVYYQTSPTVVYSPICPPHYYHRRYHPGLFR